MLFRRYGTFAGGIDLPDEKQATLNRAIEPYRPAGRIRVPLAPCGWKGASVLVEAGSRVRAAQRIAKTAARIGVDVFSPLGGRVTALGTAEVAAGDEFLPCQAVEIAPDDCSFGMGGAASVFDWRSADGGSLRERLASGSLTTFRRPTQPLMRWINRARAKGCETLVANAMESQPYVTADHRLLVEHGPDVMRGLAILGRAIEAKDIILAADSRRIGEYQRLSEPGRAHKIARIALPHKYPTGADAMLVKVLTRREVPPGGSTMDVGVAVIDVATCFAVYRWAACGVPPTGRVVTVAGPHARGAGNYWVPFGTPCLELVGRADQPVIHNGPMVGIRCSPESVVGPSTDAVLALGASAAAPPSPCIRCSWCTDHCPARLNVALLNDAFELGRIDRARKLIAPACVECGVCTYVCPARLPLSQRVRQLKRAIRDIETSMPLFAKA